MAGDQTRRVFQNTTPTERSKYGTTNASMTINSIAGDYSHKVQAGEAMRLTSEKGVCLPPARPDEEGSTATGSKDEAAPPVAFVKRLVPAPPRRSASR